MSAQAAEAHGYGYDPEEILSVLPEAHHASFMADYREAMVAAAHETWRYRELQQVLKRWHLRAIMYSRPGHDQRAEEARTGAGGPWLAADEVATPVPGLMLADALTPRQ
ncbi:hypothetical protein SAMN05421505_1558 [Sinosporangium album]|uniref:Uncharacterized protein n=1 Tax=Sinosporangium album TaxID=504805 RepID=A0A1G8KTL7_9ACTN|nr:DUF6247 family protein [Sinosporangium album]SDI46845.1 hypothetical protein SAMN05421505_1558 [Sinosporangium album]